MNKLAKVLVVAALVAACAGSASAHYWRSENIAVSGTVQSIAVDGNDDVLVACLPAGDPLKVTIKKYDGATLTLLSSFQVDVPNSGGSGSANGLDVTPDGRVVVGTCGGTNRTVTYVDPDGSDPCELDVSSVVGADPQSIASDPDGNVWWMDVWYNDVIWVHEVFLLNRNDGSKIMDVTDADLDDIGEGTKDWLWSHQGADYDANGITYVSDYYRIVSFDPCDLSNTIKVFAGDPNGGEGSGDGEFGGGIYGVEVAGEKVYACDVGNERVQIFDLSGNFIEDVADANVGTWGGMAVDSAGHIFVNSNSSIYKFSYVHEDYSSYTHSKKVVAGTCQSIAVNGRGSVFTAHGGSGEPQTVGVYKYDRITLDDDDSFTVNAPNNEATVYPTGLDVRQDGRLMVAMSDWNKDTVTYVDQDGSDPCELDVSSVVGGAPLNAGCDMDGNTWWLTLYYDDAWIFEVFLLGRNDGSKIMDIDNDDLDDLSAGAKDWGWQPGGVAVDKDGTVYVCDWARILRCDPCDMPNTIEVFAGDPDNATGSGYGEFGGHIYGLQVVGDKVYACDTGNNRVQVFDKATGDFIQAISDPCIDNAYDIAVDPVGNVYMNNPGGDSDVHVWAIDLPDSDGDGVADPYDLCNDPCTWVDVNGCPDSDQDGVADSNDLCPGTPPEVEVDEDGCPTQIVFVSALASVTATAWGDYNNDGYVDMIGPVDVYTNDGDGTFTKTSPFTGASLQVVSLGDWNNDGDLDVFSLYGGPKLMTNDGDETWTNDDALFASADNPTNCSGSTWGDWNGDGYLDTYSTGWYTNTSQDDDVIYMSNDGLGWQQTWQAPTRHGKGVMGCDYDEDGDMDIYVSNYWLDYGFLWQNNSFDGNSAGLSDVRSASGCDDGPGHTQGSTWADFDNDSDFDLFIANFAHSFNPFCRFVRNDGSPSWGFTNLGQCGVTQVEPLSGSTTGDIDNDGYLDIVITTSTGYSPPNTIMVYTNDGDFTFTDVTSAVGLSSLGPDDEAAFGDFNNDGFLDLIVADTLYRNSGNSNHWLKVRLVGGENGSGLVNSAALGAQVRINSYTGLGTLTRQVEGNTGVLGMQNDQVLHFGLGSDPCDTYDLDIDWPNGYSETIQDVNIDELTTITMTSPPDCNFTAASQSGAESVGTMTITAQLSETSDDNVTIWFTLGGTATEGAGNDYTITASPITITAGNTTADITITVNNDSLDEDDETVIVTMGTLSEAVKVSPSVHTATITDNDDPPTINFTSASQSDAEDCGTMTVTAQLSTQSGRTVTLPFTLGGTATEGAGADYTITTSPITITAGNTTGDITITVNDDPCFESDETVIVTMGTVTNATKGGTDEHTATITNNDVACETMHIEAAACDEVNCGPPNKNGRATITIYDNCSNPVENALVDGTFSGDFDESYDDVSTDENGQAVFTTTGCIKRPSWSFTVDDVTGSLTYDPCDNVTTGCSE